GRVRHRKRHSGWTVGLGQAWPAASPDQSSPCVIHYLRVRIEEFLLEGHQVGVVQVKLELQRLIGDPPVAVEPGESLVEDGKKVALHLLSSCPPVTSSILRDGVAMPLSHQTHNILRPVNNHGEQPGAVTSQDTDIECFQLGDGGILPAEHDMASVFTQEMNLGFDDDRSSHATHTAQTL